MQLRLSFWKKTERILHSQRSNHETRSCSLPALSQWSWLTNDLGSFTATFTAADRSASLLNEHHHFTVVDRGRLIELATASRCPNLYWGHRNMVGEGTTKTLRSPPLALPSKQSPKAQYVNRMASRLERQGDMWREVHSAANGTNLLTYSMEQSPSWEAVCS
jgi:hypothetical protein